MPLYTRVSWFNRLWRSTPSQLFLNTGSLSCWLWKFDVDQWQLTRSLPRLSRVFVASLQHESDSTATPIQRFATAENVPSHVVIFKHISIFLFNTKSYTEYKQTHKKDKKRHQMSQTVKTTTIILLHTDDGTGVSWVSVDTPRIIRGVATRWPPKMNKKWVFFTSVKFSIKKQA